MDKVTEENAALKSEVEEIEIERGRMRSNREWHIRANDIQRRKINDLTREQARLAGENGVLKMKLMRKEREAKTLQDENKAMKEKLEKAEKAWKAFKRMNDVFGD